MVTTPHMSANKLGEFIFATDAKKRSILKTLKFPTPFKNARYQQAQSAFLQFMVDPNHNKAILETKRNQVANTPTNNDWQKTKKQGVLEAIDHLLACSETILVEYLAYVANKNIYKVDYDKNVNGVILHLKPEVLMIDKNTNNIIGFIKLAFTKTHALNSLEANVITAAVKEHVEKSFKIKLNPKNCLLLDVFQRRKFSAQKFNQTHNIKIKMACIEIADKWSSIN